MENKALQENNKEITKYLEILEKLLIKAQNNAESLKKTCKNLESENNDLLANLKTTKQMKMYIKRLSRNESEISGDNIHDVQSANSYSNKGKLMKLFTFLNFYRVIIL